MPCVRKQGEADRIMYQDEAGTRDVDHVWTTRELGQASWVLLRCPPAGRGRRRSHPCQEHSPCG